MNLTAVVAVTTILAIPALVLLAALLGPRRRRARLRRQTATGSATIVGLKPTHTRVGHQPVTKFRLELHFGEGGQAEEMDLKIAVHPLDGHHLEVGTVLPIHFDPARTADFRIDFGGVTGIELSDL